MSVFYPFVTAKKKWRVNKNVALTYFGIGIIFIILVIPKMIDNYFQYNYKSKRAEAKVDLNNIYKLQQEYYNKNNKYAKDLEKLGFKPAKPSPRYIYTLNNKKIDGIDIDIHKDEFIAVAKSNIDREIVIDILVVSPRGDLINVVDDYTNLSKANELNRILKMTGSEFEAWNKKISPIIVAFVLAALFFVAEPIISIYKKNI
tara:strand:- start:70 stop:675 length:606 start_codon:yes stop_codon:yes gene_type:complete